METELRKTGINVVGDVPWGTHFCHFYDTKQDLLDTLVPYFKTGLESKEFCLWVVSDPELITVEEAQGALGQAVPDLDRHLSEGNIEILKGLQWYLEENVFNLERVTSAWDAKLKRALARGHEGLRVSGDTLWLREKHWKDFCAYEKQLNDSITDQPMTVLCTYSVAKSGAAEILDVVQTHRFAIARRQGEWEVIESPQLIQAKAEIRRLNEDLEQRVVERTSELRLANEELRKEMIERKQAEEALDERLRFETLVTELSAAFASLSPNEVDREIDKWLQTLVEFLGVDRASFFQFREDWTTLYLGHSYTVPGIEPLSLPPIGINEQFPWITDQLRRGNTIKWSRIPDDLPEQAAKEKKYAATTGAKSVLNIPVLVGGSVICTISFTSIGIYCDWPDSTVARLRLVGEIFAAALERKRADAERKRADEALRESEARNRAILKALPDSIFLLTNDGFFLDYYAKDTGDLAVLPEQFLGKHVKDVLPPELAESLTRGFQEITEASETRVLEYPLHVGEDQRYFEARIVRCNSDEILCVARNITDRKQAEDLLRRSEDHLRLVLDTTPALIHTGRPDGYLDYFSQRWLQYVGRSLEELQGWGWTASIHPDDVERIVNEWRASLVSGEPFQHEARVRQADGEYRWMLHRKVPLRDEHGNIVKWHGSSIDIEDRQQAEEKLLQSERQLAEAQHLANIGSWSLDLSSKAVTWSDELYRIFGVQPSEFDHNYEAVIGTTHPEDREWVRSVIEDAVKTHEPFSVYYRITKPSGELRVLHARGVVVSDEQGNASRIYGTAQDVTERKQAEEKRKASSEQLRALSAKLQSAREEESTRIAREIHDELGSALTKLKWDLELLDRETLQGEGDDNIAKLREKVRAMMRLIDETVNLVKRISGELRPSALDDLGLSAALRLHSRQFEERTRILTECYCSIEELELSRQQSNALFRIFEESLTNILRHAQATRVVVTVEKENGELVLTICDNGRGITEAERVDRNSLGLLGMRERANLIGANVDIAGTEGKGTLITVRVRISGQAEKSRVR